MSWSQIASCHLIVSLVLAYLRYLQGVRCEARSFFALDLSMSFDEFGSGLETKTKEERFGEYWCLLFACGPPRFNNQNKSRQNRGRRSRRSRKPRKKTRKRSPRGTNRIWTSCKTVGPIFPLERVVQRGVLVRIIETSFNKLVARRFKYQNRTDLTEEQGLLRLLRTQRHRKYQSLLYTTPC